METGRKYNKTITANEGQGLSNSATVNHKTVAPQQAFVATSENLQYQGEDDSMTTLTGPGGGDYVSSSENAPHRWGHTAPSGTRVEINDSGGKERVEIVHHTGAAVVIDPDGAIYLTSSSERGAGLSAPFGDYFISAGGDVVIKAGGSLTVSTPGDLNLNVGGTLTIAAAAYALQTKVMDEVIDGSASRAVTNDQSTVIGGIDRKTVAGDSREQVTGNKIVDISGNSTNRVDGDISTDVGGNNTSKIGGNNSLSVGGDNSIASSGNATLSSESDMNLVASGDANLTGEGQATVYSGGPVKLTGSEVNASPAVDRALWADEAAQAGLAAVLGGGIGLKPPEKGGSAGSGAEVQQPTEAQTVDADDIVDSLTSARKYPEYPGNGVLESANHTSYSMVSYDQTPQAEDVYNEYSGINRGNINPFYSGGSYDYLPDTPINRSPDIASIDPGISVPARHNNNAKISKYFTLGQIVNAKHSHKIPPSRWESVVQNHIFAAYNVLDPIKAKFPDVLVTSAYRSNSSNHITGRAIDLVVESRSLTRHAEIARFARDNLPVDQVFIERNASGKTHVHLRVSQTGAKTTPVVLTCADPKCQNSTPGINVEFLARKVV